MARDWVYSSGLEHSSSTEFNPERELWGRVMGREIRK